jgi:hypothetical protein
VDDYDLCFITTMDSWGPHVVDLSGYAGQSVLLQIRVETDFALLSNLYVDDVSFQISPLVEPGSRDILDAGGVIPRPANRQTWEVQGKPAP